MKSLKKPSLYNHIKSQEDIYHGIMIYGWQNGAEKIAEIIVEEDAHEALRKYAHAFYQYAMDNPGIFEAMLWYNKYKSEELIKATEKVYTFFFAQTDKLHIEQGGCKSSSSHISCISGRFFASCDT